VSSRIHSESRATVVTAAILARAPVKGKRASQTPVVLIALAGILVLGALIQQAVSTRLVLLFLTGTALGVVLYQSLFGFTGAFRALLADGRSAGFRAQMIMLGAACLLFFPTLGVGSLWGHPAVGFVSPVGVSVVIGSFLFGVGMQLGGGCASGTLFSVGGGNTKMVLTLLFFIVGSVVGVVHLAWWETLPSFAPISLIATFGWPMALLVNIAVFAASYVVVARIERTRHGTLQPIASVQNGSWLRGPWPLLAGALGLALLNFVTLALAGRPWGITSAFGLWGGMALQHLGLPVESWSGYSASAMQKALAGNVLSDVTSVMDFGIVIGAMMCAGLARKFKPEWRISARHVAASMLGGFLLGYGARLAYGCNIGAFFSGIVSGSVHGWVWIVFALIGNWAALRLRPFFDLPVPNQPTRC
jgi:uncharacterized membrane protein YedE/YeeE